MRGRLSGASTDSTPSILDTSQPLAFSVAKVIVWLGHCQDQIRQQDCKSSSLPVCAGLFSSDVMSHLLIHANVLHWAGEDVRMCGCGF